MSASLTFYRLLIKLYPASFREQFGTELERQFRDDYSGVRRTRDVAHLWLWMLADVLVSMPKQFAMEVSQDAGHAFRLWRRRPMHTGVAVVVLAVAVGANTAAFSVLNALLLRALPFVDVNVDGVDVARRLRLTETSSKSRSQSLHA
jgi:putative ABC transport system permease protein